jgi:hypothetical protein
MLKKNNSELKKGGHLLRIGNIKDRKINKSVG